MPKPMPLLLLGAGALLLMSKKGKSGAPVEKGEELTEEPPGPGPLDEIPVPEAGAEPEPEPPQESLREKCDRFIEEIWVETEGDDELPVNAVAVEESIIPALHEYISNVADEKGAAVVDQDVSPGCVLAAMEAIAPGCEWEVVDLAWRYAGGLPIMGKVNDVLVAVMRLVPQVTKDVNVEKGYAKKTGFVSKKSNQGGGIGDIGG